MQDSRDGQMTNIPKEFLASLGIDKLTKGQLEEAIRQRMIGKIPREYQGPILYIGEVVEIKGGRFRITHMKRDRIILKGISSE